MRRRKNKPDGVPANRDALTCPYCMTPDNVRVVASDRLTGLTFIVKCRANCVKCGAIFSALIYHNEDKSND